MLYMENEGVKERLQTYIEYKNIPVSKFEKICGLSNGYVSSIRTSVQPDRLLCIARNFPELNIGWLMVGEEYGGPMIKQEQQSHQVSPGVNVQNVQAVFITNWQDIAGAVAKAMGGKQ